MRTQVADCPVEKDILGVREDTKLLRKTASRKEGCSELRQVLPSCCVEQREKWSRMVDTICDSGWTRIVVVLCTVSLIVSMIRSLIYSFHIQMSKSPSLAPSCKPLATMCNLIEDGFTAKR